MYACTPRLSRLRGIGIGAVRACFLSSYPSLFSFQDVRLASCQWMAHACASKHHNPPPPFSSCYFHTQTHTRVVTPSTPRLIPLQLALRSSYFHVQIPTIAYPHDKLALALHFTHANPSPRHTPTPHTEYVTHQVESARPPCSPGHTCPPTRPRPPRTWPKTMCR